MKKRILNLGRTKLVIIITIISTLLAVASDIAIAKLLDHNINISEDLVRAGIIPLLLAPFLSWYLVGLLFELNKLEKKMNALATYDDLTGVYNRRAFYKSCESIHKYSMRNRQNYCILVIDLDHFKKINDEYGHAAGDKILASFGRASSSLSRKSDILGRLGGEEFAFFLPNTNTKQAEEFSQRLRNKIQNLEITYEGNHIEYTVSIGICRNPCDNELSINDVLKNADKALYFAKNNGRNQVSTFTQ